MVTFTVPNDAAFVVVMVRVLVLLVVDGLKIAVTPAGRFEADKVMLPEKPVCRVTVTVLALLAFCPTLRLLGAAVRENAPRGGGTLIDGEADPPPQALSITLSASDRMSNARSACRDPPSMRAKGTKTSTHEPRCGLLELRRKKIPSGLTRFGFAISHRRLRSA
jgi:hypothetical protein